MRVMNVREFVVGVNIAGISRKVCVCVCVGGWCE